MIRKRTCLKGTKDSLSYGKIRKNVRDKDNTGFAYYIFNSAMESFQTLQAITKEKLTTVKENGGHYQTSNFRHDSPCVWTHKIAANSNKYSG